MAEELVPYNAERVPYIFGLQNTSNHCYFNSLIQALMSCPAFNDHLINNKESYQKQNNLIVQNYLSIYERNLERSNAPPIESAATILHELFTTRKEEKRQYYLSTNGQEDVDEGFHLLLESIGGNVELKFQNRYDEVIICLKCRHKSCPGDKPDYVEPPCLVIHLTDEDSVWQHDLSNKKEVESFILRNVQVPRDYTCERCGVKNEYNKRTKQVMPNIVQIYNLVRVSEVIVLVFKKYGGKKKKFFPDTLDFESETGPLHYKLVAQIEHLGVSNNSGHYVSRCMRQGSEDFFQKRLSKSKSNYQELTKKMEALSLETDKADIRKRLSENSKIIESSQKELNASTHIFHFNDSSMRFASNGFEVTEDTYMIFYHLVS